MSDLDITVILTLRFVHNETFTFLHYARVDFYSEEPTTLKMNGDLIVLFQLRSLESIK